MPSATERLAEQLRGDIAAGVLAEGARLPSISALEAAGNTRSVIHQALARLRAEGLITSRQGAGYFVAKRFNRIRRVSPGRLSAQWWRNGQAIQDHDTSPRPRTVNVVVGDVEPPPDVAKLLGLEPGGIALSRSREFEVESRAVQLSVSYLPTDLTRGTRIEHTDTGPGGTYARLAEQGWGPTRFVESVVGRAPSPEEVEALGLRRGSGTMVHQVTREAWSRDRCVEVNRMVLDAEVYELVYEFPA